MAIIALAVLWTIGMIPRVPIASEIIGLLAVLIAPGVAMEPVFHGNRWTLVERLGLAAALSLALSGLLGVGLHMAGVPVSPTNILILVLIVSASAGALSIRFRRTGRERLTPRSMRLEVLGGLWSLALLATGFVSVLILHPAPEGPALEVMAIDGEGQLQAMPIRSASGGTKLTVAIRSAAGAARSASVDVGGDGIDPWSASHVAIGPTWTAVQVPIGTSRIGPVLATVKVIGSGGIELSLPIAIEVAP